jgi:hypothetical protein
VLLPLPLLLMLLSELSELELELMLMVFGPYSDNGFLFGEDTQDTGCYFVMDYGWTMSTPNSWLKG